MARIPLKIQGVTGIAASPETGLLIVTDEQERWQLSVFCGPIERHELGIRRGRYEGNEKEKKEAAEYLQYSLPETLIAIIKYMTSMQLQVIIVSVFDGEYRAIIEDATTGTAFPIRITDGILLSYADQHIPLLIEESLWLRQRVRYRGENAQGIAMPVNTLSLEMLQEAMEKCVEEEQYEAAQQLKAEIDRRSHNS